MKLELWTAEDCMWHSFTIIIVCIANDTLLFVNNNNNHTCIYNEMICMHNYLKIKV